ncbi:MAG: hypothetical protein H0T46_05230 [Deltaproteobacteria bacterium]|nr:hypothetical protein [Deltaproteobacteria bacterium]
MPLHGADEDGAGEGTGGLTAQLKYVDNIKNSYGVKVTGDFKKGDQAKAETQAKSFIGTKLATLGDIDMVEGQAQADIENKMPDAQNVKVSITINEKSKDLKDAGKTHVYYKARQNPGILLNVPVVQVAEKVVTSSGSTTKTSGSEQSAEATGGTTTNTVKVDQTKKKDEASGSSTTTETSEDYHKESKRTYQEIVSKIESKIATFTSDLVSQADSVTDYKEDGEWKFHNEEFKFEDYTKNVKGGSEEGDKDKKNWAAYLEDALGTVDEIIDIPILKQLPGGAGKFLRKLNRFGLAIDLGKKAAGAFAVRGKVHFKDTHEDTDITKKTTGTADGKGSNNTTATTKTKANAESHLTQKMTSVMSSVKNKYGTDNTTVDVTKKTKSTTNTGGASTSTESDDYKKTDTTTTAGGTVKAKQNQSTTAEIGWSQTATEKTTKPVLQATIIDGDGEVSSTPFGAPPKKTK